jgi:hypothetical protein
MYNPETVESLLAYPGRYTRPSSSASVVAGARREPLRGLLRKVRKSA